MATATRPRGARRASCVPIYLAVVKNRRGTTCPFADVEIEQVEAFVANYNNWTDGARAVVEVSRYRLPAAKGGAR